MDAHRRSFGRGVYFAVLAATCAGLFFLHVWLNVDPRLIDQRQPAVFLTGWDFLGRHLDRPGGLAAYAAALLAQFHWLGWPGAAVLALLALTAAALMRTLLRRLGASWTWPALVPVPLLAILADHYDHPLTTPVGLVAALGWANVFAWTSPRQAWGRAALFAALAAALYYAAAGAMLLFAALAAVAELVAGRDRRLAARALLAAAYLAWAAAVPLAASAWVFVITRTEAYTAGLALAAPQDTAALAGAIGLYAWPIVAAIAAAWHGRRAADERRRWLTRIAGVAAAGAVLAAGTILALASLDPLERSLLRVDWCAQEGRWTELLAEPAAQRVVNPHVQQCVTRALFHTGRLLDDLFSLPLTGEETPLPRGLVDFYTFAGYRRTCDEMLELGRVSEAEHAAYEDLELLGEQPRNLKHLVRINALKDRPEAAKVFLEMLRKTLWGRAWAEKCLTDLRDDPSLGGDPDVQRARSLMFTTDLADNPSSSAALLELLRTNPRNRMAAEFLMAHYLLARRSDLVAANLARLRQCGMTELPRHVQEAVVQFAWHHRDQPIPLFGFALSREVCNGYPRFVERLAPHAKDPAGAWNALKDRYGRTYWFYATFGCTPLGRQGPPPALAKEAPQ